MRKMTVLDRILLLVTGLLAAYQIAIGLEGVPSPAVWAYTIAFGVLLIAGLLLLIFGFEALDSPIVVMVSTTIPLALSLGLVWQYLPAWQLPYLIFAAAGFVFIVLTRLTLRGRAAAISLSLVHGIAGLLILCLPIAYSLQGRMPPHFVLVGLGGTLIGVGGLLLLFLKMGRPLLSQAAILRILPGLLLLMTAAFVVGFANL